MYIKLFQDLKTHVEALQLGPKDQLMIFIADESSDFLNEMMDYLNKKNITFFGAIFPGIIMRNKLQKEGFIIQKYEPIYSSMVFPNLMNIKLSSSELENSTAIVLVDGLSSKMKVLTETIYSKLGKNVKYIGGGAGFYDLKHRPCVFNNNGTFEDVLQVCIIKSDVNLAVKHGWKRFKGPYSVTKSQENILCELDENSAFDVYRDVIEEIEGFRLSKEDFFDFAKEHPFGIVQKDLFDVIVRDPIMVNDNDDIVCVASVPQGSEVYILKGDVDNLLNSSLQMAEFCEQNAPERYIPLLFDCISRSMFMESRFNEELQNIQGKMHFSVEGALSIGEISSQKSGELVIHNKSTIMGLLPI